MRALTFVHFAHKIHITIMKDLSYECARSYDASIHFVIEANDGQINGNTGVNLTYSLTSQLDYLVSRLTWALTGHQLYGHQFHYLCDHKRE